MENIFSVFKQYMNVLNYANKRDDITKKAMALGIDYYDIDVRTDFKVNVSKSVNLDGVDFSKIDFEFYEILGNFSAQSCIIDDKQSKKLPRIVGGRCELRDNRMTSLIDGPRKIGEELDISCNPIQSFKNRIIECGNIIIDNSILDNQKDNLIIELTLNEFNQLAFKEDLKDLSVVLDNTIPNKPTIKKNKI